MTRNHLSKYHLGVYVLADLPNTPGFEFTGVDRDGNEFPCVVKLDPSGCASTYTPDGTPCFFRLVGWRK